MNVPSERALAMVEGFEISDAATYDRFYARPTWPGGASGVTVGVGFDCGYEAEAQIEADFAAHLPDAMVSALCSVAGLKGAVARAAVSRVRSVVYVPWLVATLVFRTQNVPRYSALVAGAFPNTDDLSEDAFGALFSLVFNRGAGMQDSPGQNNRLEMRQIRDAMAARQFGQIPGLLRAMKRLWIGSMPGLVTRREAEASLFERGLITPVPVPASIAIDPGEDEADRLMDLFNPGL